MTFFRRGVFVFKHKNVMTQAPSRERQWPPGVKPYSPSHEGDKIYFTEAWEAATNDEEREKVNKEKNRFLNQTWHSKSSSDAEAVDLHRAWYHFNLRNIAKKFTGAPVIGYDPPSIHNNIIHSFPNDADTSTHSSDPTYVPGNSNTSDIDTLRTFEYQEDHGTVSNLNDEERAMVDHYDRQMRTDGDYLGQATTMYLYNINNKSRRERQELARRFRSQLNDRLNWAGKPVIDYEPSEDQSESSGASYVSTEPEIYPLSSRVRRAIRLFEDRLDTLQLQDPVHQEALVNLDMKTNLLGVALKSSQGPGKRNQHETEFINKLNETLHGYGVQLFTDPGFDDGDEPNDDDSGSGSGSRYSIQTIHGVCDPLEDRIEHWTRVANKTQGYKIGNVFNTIIRNARIRCEPDDNGDVGPSLNYLNTEMQLHFGNVLGKQVTEEEYAAVGRIRVAVQRGRLSAEKTAGYLKETDQKWFDNLLTEGIKFYVNRGGDIEETLRRIKEDIKTHIGVIQDRTESSNFTADLED